MTDNDTPEPKQPTDELDQEPAPQQPTEEKKPPEPEEEQKSQQPAEEEKPPEPEEEQKPQQPEVVEEKAPEFSVTSDHLKLLQKAADAPKEKPPYANRGSSTHDLLKELSKAGYLKLFTLGDNKTRVHYRLTDQGKAALADKPAEQKPAQPEQPTEEKKPPKPVQEKPKKPFIESFENRPIGEYGEDNDALFSDEINSLGYRVEMWGELIDGRAEDLGKFWKAFYDAFKSRKVSCESLKWKDVSAYGFFSDKTREVMQIRRNPVTITVYMATQGKDLYISWRSFLKSSISVAKVGMFVALGVLIFLFLTGVLNSLPTNQLNPQYQTRVNTVVAINALVAAVVVLFPLVMFGFSNTGDPLGYLRAGYSSMVDDDLLALSTAVHRSLMEAADKLDIDTAKLTVREPFYTQSSSRAGRPRRRM